MRLYIDDKPSNIDEICTLLKIKKNEVPFQRKNRSFKRLGFDNKRDPQNQKPIVPRGHGIPCSINVVLENGESKRITYADNSRQETRNGLTRLKHSPINLMLPGLTLALTDDQTTKFFFLYIHHYNKQSPLNIGKPNPNCIYQFNDTAKLAKEEDDKEELFFEALSMLKALDEPQLRQVAKGYKMFGVDDLTEVEVRSLVRAKLKLNPAQFIVDLESNEIAIEGIIQDAIDKGIIAQVHSGTETVWNLGTKQLAKTPNGSLPMPYLRAEIESNLEHYFPLLEKGIESKVSATNLQKPDNAKFFQNFKRKNDSEQPYAPLDTLDKKLITETAQEKEIADKLRSYFNEDVNNPDLHHAKKKSMIEKAELIMVQWNKDKEAGLLPEGATPPVLEVKQLENA